MRQSGIATAALFAATVAVATGCSTQSGSPVSEPVSAESTKSSTKAFDPCTDINDATIVRMGLDPASKKTAGISAVPDSLYPGCDIDTPQEGVTKMRPKLLSFVRSDSTTLEKQRERFKATVQPPFQVNGRDSFMSVNEINSTGSCLLLLRLDKGVLFVVQHINPGEEKKGVQPCEGLPALAQTLEPSLPKGN